MFSLLFCIVGIRALCIRARNERLEVHPVVFYLLGTGKSQHQIACFGRFARD